MIVEVITSAEGFVRCTCLKKAEDIVDKGNDFVPFIFFYIH